jgi:hypothetical protein
MAEGGITNITGEIPKVDSDLNEDYKIVKEFFSARSQVFQGLMAVQQRVLSNGPFI